MKTLRILTLAAFFLIGIKATAQIDKTKQTQKFHLIDADGNEVITIREMVAYYEGKLDKQGAPVDGKVVFYGLDANKNSIVTMDEFLKGINWKEGRKRVEDNINKRTPDYAKERKKIITTNSKREDKFHKIDKNRNNEINLEEMINFHKGWKNKKGKPVESELMFYGLDTNEDNKLTLEEYLQDVNWKAGKERMKSSKPQNSEPKLTSSNSKLIDKFNRIDTNVSNELSIEEVQKYYEGRIGKNGEEINGSIVFYGLDIDDDGKVSIAEFNNKINWRLGKQKLKEVNSTSSQRTYNVEKAVDSYAIDTPTEDYVNDQITKFSKVDTDKNYKLTLEELISFYKGKTNKNGKLINAEVMFYGMDANDNDSVDLGEFANRVDLVKAIQKIKANKG